MDTWKLTVRHGSDVSREGFDELDAAIAAAERQVAEIRGEGDLRDVSMLGEFKAADQIHARVEVSGKGLLRAPTAGVDLHGDGSLVPFEGGLRRRKLSPGPGESAFDAVRAALR